MTAAAQVSALTPRWTPLRQHDEQLRLIHSRTRFRVVPAGRRSGKSERAKRHLVLSATAWPQPDPDARYFAAAPTRDQAKAIYWDDLKRMIPPALMTEAPRESELMIRLINGAQLWVLGMDKPQRVEGRPWNGGILDEYADMKPEAWTHHVRPSLSDRMGWCWLIGVPEGRNHYYDQYRYARDANDPDWSAHHWTSDTVLPESEIEAAKRVLDEQTFDQEYRASFLNFQGRAYWPFIEQTHCARLSYDPRAPIALCFDFNVSPGVAAICQDQQLPSGHYGVGVIGEVHIPRNSNTPAVVNKFISLYGKHQGRIDLYGDASGGADGSAKVAGSDWAIIERMLRNEFGGRIQSKVPDANPRERIRLNAVNSLLKSASDEIRLMVDAARAPFVVKDFEGVKLLEGGSGEIDKKATPALTHLTDAIGYYCHARSKPATAVVRKLKGY